jgi:hypothetical protein
MGLQGVAISEDIWRKVHVKGRERLRVGRDKSSIMNGVVIALLMGGDEVAIIVGGHLARYGITFTRLDFPFLYNSRLSPPFRRRGVAAEA